MKKYQEYKDSGIEWLGDIPIHWDVIKIKWLTPVYRGASPRPIADPKYFDDNGEFAWVRIADVSASERYLENTTERLSELGASLSVKQYPGSLFLSVAGSVGKPIITKIKCCIHDGFVWFPELKINPEYLFYLFQIGLAFQGLGKVGTQLNLNTDTIGNIFIPNLSDNDYNVIVRFLDHKTSQIDALIQKKEQLVEKLKLKRQAVINETVTKGINPDLPMKDSGIEWLGEIPEHWSFCKAKRNTYMKGRIGWQGLKQDEFIDEGPYLITGMNFKDGKIRWDEVYHITQERYDQAPEIQLKEGDVLMTKDGTIGKLLYVDSLPGPASLNSHLLVLRCIDGSYIPKYLYYQLMTELFQEHIELHKTGTTFFGITQESVGKYQMLLPTIEEQVGIVKYIETKTHQIESLLQKGQDSIDKLKQYRQSIISEAVTGKIDVRDWQKSELKTN